MHRRSFFGALAAAVAGVLGLSKVMPANVANLTITLPEQGIGLLQGIVVRAEEERSCELTGDYLTRCKRLLRMTFKAPLPKGMQFRLPLQNGFRRAASTWDVSVDRKHYSVKVIDVELPPA